ncbi:MAG: hypothetical protein ACTIDN_06680 [Acetobacter sp.]|uniref:hypothetical protein n=1 Tax=Acetobacter sp. TaxID=440 RepID=UPI003F922380
MPDEQLSLPSKKDKAKNLIVKSASFVSDKARTTKDVVKTYYTNTDYKQAYQFIKNKALSVKEAKVLEKYWPYIEKAITAIATSPLLGLLTDELIIGKLADKVVDLLPPHIRLVVRKTGADRILIAALFKSKGHVLKKIADARHAKEQEATSRQLVPQPPPAQADRNKAS